MLASYRWLKDLAQLDWTAQEMADRLTAVGLEVEEIKHVGELDKVVVAEVRGTKPHPKRDKLTLVDVFDGHEQHQIVCGASNVPEAGRKVILAQVGATLPGDFHIAPRKLGGIESAGMLCAEDELGIGTGGAGIYVFPENTTAKPGDAIARALDLRDSIFDIGLTPNRPDCLGHVGLARELCAIAGKAFEPKTFAAPKTAPGEMEVSIEIADGTRCPRYAAARVTNVKVAPSPFWLSYRLHNLGVRSINNLVDATNLVMLEQGHPIHGFDLDKVRGRRIVVRRAEAGEKMTTLDDVERTLSDDDLLICDGEGAVALAGVMGGGNSEISESTHDVLIECAYFEPRGVRRTARRLGLHTDASHRFERGVDPSAVPRVLQRASQLMAELGGGQAVGAPQDQIATPFEAKTVTMRHARAASLMGHEYPPEISERILSHLGCEVVSHDDEAITVRAPGHRPDLTREEDLIEEVARVHGYEHVETRLPKVRPSASGTPERIRFHRRLREAAAHVGLFEAISYSFLSRALLEDSKAFEGSVPVENPLNEEKAFMRTSLMPGLAWSAANAQRHGAQSIALFEVGHTFHDTDHALPTETMTFGVLLVGKRPEWLGAEGDYDFYDLKGRLLAALSAAGVHAPLSFAIDEGRIASDAPFLHPRRAAVISLGDNVVGEMGELHPDVAESFGIMGRAVFARVEVDPLGKDGGVPQAKPLPKYPGSHRDLALLLDEGLLAGDIAATLRDEGGKLVAEVEVFDVYRGEQVPDGKKSIAFRVEYRDESKTLTDRDVDKVHGKITKIAKSKFDAEVR